MAFTEANLYLVTPLGGGRSLWYYETLDTAATVDTAAYFTGEALKKLKLGDLLFRTTWSTAIGSGGTISTQGFHTVNASDGSAIDVADTLAITATDTD